MNGVEVEDKEIRLPRKSPKPRPKQRLRHRFDPRDIPPWLAPLLTPEQQFWYRTEGELYIHILHLLINLQSPITTTTGVIQGAYIAQEVIAQRFKTTRHVVYRVIFRLKQLGMVESRKFRPTRLTLLAELPTDRPMLPTEKGGSQ